MKAVEYEEGKAIARKNVCAVCAAPLLVAWGGYWKIGSWVIRCGLVPSHEGYCRPSRSVRTPIYIQNNMDKKEKKKLVEEHGEQVGTVVAKYQASTSLTREEAREIIQSFWPEAPEAEVIKAAITCNTYGLNPCMRHLFLIPYLNKQTGITTWAHVLGIGATRLMASRRGPVGYSDGPRIMTASEQEAIRGAVDKVNWQTLCTVRDQYGLTATGYGNYPMADTNLKGRNKGNSEQNMAFIRAERNALDKKFPGEMPSHVGTVDEAYMGDPAKGDYIVGEVKDLGHEPLEKGQVTGSPDPPTGGPKDPAEAEEALFKPVDEPPTGPPATSAQLIKIDALRGKLGIEEAEFKRTLFIKHGREVTIELTKDQAAEVIESMAAKIEGKK